jgi:Spy/CpxP family protein refolding chaperone
MIGKTTTLVAMALAASAAIAGAQRRDSVRPMRGAQMGRRGPRDGLAVLAERQLFRGITLTDAQQTQLQKLESDDRTQFQALARSARADREAMLTARENGDTTALKAARRKVEGWSNRRIALRGQFLSTERRLLTAAQAKQFDANRARVQRRTGAAMRSIRRQRLGRRRWAMMRAMTPNRGRFAPRRTPSAHRRGRGWATGRGGFRQGRGFRSPGGRGGPPSGAQPPDSSHAPAQIGG